MPSDEGGKPGLSPQGQAIVEALLRQHFHPKRRGPGRPKGARRILREARKEGKVPPAKVGRPPKRTEAEARTALDLFLEVKRELEAEAGKALTDREVLRRAIEGALGKRNLRLSRSSETVEAWAKDVSRLRRRFGLQLQQRHNRKTPL